MLEHLVMLWPKEECSILKMSLGTLVPVNLDQRKGQGGRRKGERLGLKDVLASRNFFKLNSGPGTTPEEDGPGSSQSLLFPNRKELHELHLQYNIGREVVLALQILQMCNIDQRWLVEK